MNGNWNVKNLVGELENRVFAGKDKVLIVKEQSEEIMIKTDELRKKVNELRERNQLKLQEVLEKIKKNVNH